MFEIFCRKPFLIYRTGVGPAPAAAPAPAQPPAGAPSANPAPQTGAGAGGPLDFLRNHPQFIYLR